MIALVIFDIRQSTIEILKGTVIPKKVDSIVARELGILAQTFIRQ
jgi:hypothetical protein